MEKPEKETWDDALRKTPSSQVRRVVPMFEWTQSGEAVKRKKKKGGGRGGQQQACSSKIDCTTPAVTCDTERGSYS